MTTRSTRIERFLAAPPAVVYRVMLDPTKLARWKVPEGMRLTVHDFEPREGGRLRIALAYDAPDAVGKTTAHVDRYHGRFVRLVPGELIVEEDEFESDDPAMRGTMTITIHLVAVEGGTRLTAVHEHVPTGVSLADNEVGWTMALGKLASLVQER